MKKPSFFNPPSTPLPLFLARRAFQKLPTETTLLKSPFTRRRCGAEGVAPKAPVHDASAQQLQYIEASARHSFYKEG